MTAHEISCSVGSRVKCWTAQWKGWDKPVPELDVSDPRELQGLDLCGGRSFFPHFEPGEWGALVADKAAELDHKCVCLEERGGTIDYN